jgi:hypothetical protein
MEDDVGRVLDPETCRQAVEQMTPAASRVIAERINLGDLEALERANMILLADARSRAALRRRAAAPGAPRRSREVRRGRAARPGRRRRSSVSRDDGGSDSSESDGPAGRAEVRRLAGVVS